MNHLKGSILSLYAVTHGSAFFGFIVVLLLNLFTPLDFFDIPRSFFYENRWIVFFAVFPAIVALTFVPQFIVQRPIYQYVSRSLNGKKCPERMRDKAKRRLINLPFVLGLVILILWIVVPLLLAVFFHFFKDIEGKTSLFFFSRAVMIGMISSTISLFLVEDRIRKRLMPWFFPEGRLSAVEGAIRVSVSNRIRALYFAGTTVPMLILLSTLLLTLLELKDFPISPYELAGEILMFAAVLGAVFFFIALRLNSLVEGSILNPLREILGVVGRIRQGDFSARIKVLSNDEIGDLGDAGNRMIRGLSERERIRDSFGKYVTPEIRDQILEGSIPLDGERKEVTLFFCDLRNFTVFVEENDPEEVIRSMRSYFTVMDNAIRRHNGLVLQYAGDEIEAVFGVPLFDPEHAEKAVLAALDMRKGLERLNGERTKRGKSRFRHGIGVHTGHVLAGNTGSERHLSYSLIGNTVNLASRIQGLTKQWNCDILLSKVTVERLSNTYTLSKKPPVKVKGFNEKITTYQLLG